MSDWRDASYSEVYRATKLDPLFDRLHLEDDACCAITRFCDFFDNFSQAIQTVMTRLEELAFCFDRAHVDCDPLSIDSRWWTSFVSEKHVFRQTIFPASVTKQVIEEDVMRWLYALHLRAPDSTVILVANKCDSTIQNVSDTINTVTTRVSELLDLWNDSRGFASHDTNHTSTLNVLAETSKISCRDNMGLAELIDTVMAQSSTSISVPPSWDLALVVIDALRDKKSPQQAAREHLSLPSGARENEVAPSDLYIPKAALARQWHGILRTLTETGELQSAAGRAVVLNPGSALEGALWIR